jgi:hypothetical protein
MRAVHLVSAGVVACLLMQAAEAADNGIYAGLTIGQAQTEFPDDVSDVFDDKDTGFKLLVGLRPMDWWAVEVAYIDLGEVTQSTDIPVFDSFKLEQSAFGAFGLLLYDISMVDLFAKAGLVRWDAELSANSPIFGPIPLRVRENGTDLAWGLGAQVRFGSLAARLEYERYEIDSSDGLIGKPDMVSLGLTWTFF